MPGTHELIIIAVIVLLLFGGAKLPQLMKGLGQGIGEFNKGLQDSKKAMREAADSSKPDQENTKADTAKPQPVAAETTEKSATKDA